MTRSLHRALARIAFLAACLAFMPGAHAHKASDAYLRLQADGADVKARVDIALRDLDRDLDLDRDVDDALSWREVRTRWSDIVTLAQHGIAINADGQPCVAGVASGDDGGPALTTHSDGRYAVLRLVWHCAAAPLQLGVDYRLFATTDPTHRGIVRIAGNDPDQPLATAVLSPGAGVHRFRLPQAVPSIVAAASGAGPAAVSATAATFTTASTLAASESGTSGAPGTTSTSGAPGSPATPATTAPDDDTPTTFPGFVAAGIHHILIGADHILFLLSLLLPSVWVRGRAQAAPAASEARATPATRPGWLPAPAWRPALMGVLKVVTAFTVAHSITLALAVFDIVDPPSRWVESLIAASVVAAALNNLWPVVKDGRWKVAFVFGLVHGFGFASALKDSGLAHGALVSPLVGFNVGVEIGQLGIVALCLPLAWALRATRTYRGAFTGGSWAIASVAGIWLVQRAFDLQLIAG